MKKMFAVHHKYYIVGIYVAFILRKKSDLVLMKYL